MMRITVDQNGYVSSWQSSDDLGVLSGSFEVEDDLEKDSNFISYSKSYRMVGKHLQLDENKMREIETEERKKDIRNQREIECFSVINRGEAWYWTLTDEQKEELKTWYQAWLDAPQTMKVPSKPTWLN